MLISIFDKSVVPNAEDQGGKGAGLIWMQQQGINVPPALIIPTSVCVQYMASPKTTMKLVAAELKKVGPFFKAAMGETPLLSVRSGARVSMPGMMDTILNVGLDTKTLQGWSTKLGEACANDSFKRLITMYGNVVKGIPREKLDAAGTIPEALALYERSTGKPFPTMDAQLLSSVEAVFKSWNNERAQTYRKLNNIPGDWGTAVVIQAMVFGNLNEDSGTGVLFTRDPDSGVNEVVGEFLINAQGEDVVAGTATPMKLTAMAAWNPAVAVELIEAVSKLELLKKDVQDVEFTIQDKKLYILQTRTAKRSAFAAVRIVIDMLLEGLIDEKTASLRVTERELDLAESPVIAPGFSTKPDFTGIPACSGVVTGVVCRTSASAVEMAKLGKKVILVSEETTPDDIAGMNAAVGILTMTGGSTSHAAVVARSMNRCCVVGLGNAFISAFKQGAVVSLDGATGRVWFGEVPVVGGANPLVASIRAAKVGTNPLLVNSAPSFKVKNITLELGNILHFSNGNIVSIVEACIAKCDVLSFSVTPGTSADFYTPHGLSERTAEILKVIQDLFPNLIKPVLYGFKYAGYETQKLIPTLTLAELVLLKKSVLVQSIAEAGSVAFEKVAGWQAQDGITVGLWNAKGGKGPKSYSIASENA